MISASQKGFIYCHEIDGDEVISLLKLEQLIQEMKKKYGIRSQICFDAGHNNVSAMIKPSRKKK